ncbi:MAG: response regulator [Deltaproteobacteria bacterium]|nr:response regulator [Deltaproteobacteria bacterium]
MSAQRSVLVVDDDEQLLRLIVRLLESAGHRVRTAASLRETLALFDTPAGRTPEIELALLDVNLAPGGGAAELLPLLQARAPGLEVLLMSGDALPESLESELSRRGGRFLRKPFAPKALLQLIAETGGPRAAGDPGDGAAGKPAGSGH